MGEMGCPGVLNRAKASQRRGRVHRHFITRSPAVDGGLGQSPDTIGRVHPSQALQGVGVPPYLSPASGFSSPLHLRSDHAAALPLPRPAGQKGAPPSVPAHFAVQTWGHYRQGLVPSGLLRVLCFCLVAGVAEAHGCRGPCHTGVPDSGLRELPRFRFPAGLRGTQAFGAAIRRADRARGFQVLRGTGSAQAT